MRTWKAWAAALLLCIGVTTTAAAAPGHGSGKTLKAFSGERDFEQFLARWQERIKRQESRVKPLAAPALPPPPPSPPSPPAADAAASTSLDRVEVTGSRISAQDLTSITNVQTVGVDEGDIVKLQGDYLVILRRGRLFTVRIGNDTLTPVATVKAYAPDVDPNRTWYDEMLIADGIVVVIGYSYERGGTEIGLFDLDERGGLHYRGTYQLTSNDYYSADNYASRLIGHELIFYTPLEINSSDLGTPAGFLPHLRRWHKGATPSDFKRILPATRIYRTDAELDLDEGVALHTVSRCDLAVTPMQCESTAVLGPAGRVFYVSEDAAYVWTTPWNLPSEKPNASALFRIPLDGTAPSALKTSGSPITQMSFLQRDGWLNVLVGSEADGEGMWSSHSMAGELALLRVPLNAFGDGRSAARRSDYRALPGIDINEYDLENRFVGDWLLYGTGEPWGRNRQSDVVPAYALRYAESAAPVQKLPVNHWIDRIDALGRDAILVGSREDDLLFTSLRLGQRAHPVSTYVQRNATQGDERTHGFFYKPRGEDEGIVGLPVLKFDDEGNSEAAAVLYLKNRSLRLDALGMLDGARRAGIDDDCKASCVDWYGNARPIFIGDRVFALLGYELVEGRVDDGGIRERRRIDFTPTITPTASVGTH